MSPAELLACRTTKLIEYRSMPPMQPYVMLEQDQMLDQDQALATVIGRTETGWSLDVLDATGILAMPEIGIEVPMAELYEGVELPPEPAPDA